MTRCMNERGGLPAGEKKKFLYFFFASKHGTFAIQEKLYRTVLSSFSKFQKLILEILILWGVWWEDDGALCPCFFATVAEDPEAKAKSKNPSRVYLERQMGWSAWCPREVLKKPLSRASPEFLASDAPWTPVPPSEWQVHAYLVLPVAQTHEVFPSSSPVFAPRIRKRPLPLSSSYRSPPLCPLQGTLEAWIFGPKSFKKTQAAAPFAALQYSKIKTIFIRKNMRENGALDLGKIVMARTSLLFFSLSCCLVQTSKMYACVASFYTQHTPDSDLRTHFCFVHMPCTCALHAEGTWNGKFFPFY